MTFMTYSQTFSPKRIVCLTEETTETLYLLGEQDRIVGISGFTVRPPEARKEKPKISTFIDAKIEMILDLKPDLVIGFSDIQAEIGKKLIKEGVTVWVNNHRTIKGIFDMIFQLGALVEKPKEAKKVIEGYLKKIDKIKHEVKDWNKKPKVYFEEWNNPIITAINWVHEIIEICGGENIFKDKSLQSLAKNRIVKNPNDIIQYNPDVILASWCGKAFKKKELINRDGWDQIQAIQDKQVFEIDSSIILQPGPACLSDGINEIYRILSNWQTQVLKE